MHKMFCVIGESCSGKTTLVNTACKENNLLYHLKTYTSRPQRTVQEDTGYTFIKAKEMLEMIMDNGKIMYGEVFNNWFYGYENPLQVESGNYSIVSLSPKALMEMKEDMFFNNQIEIVTIRLLVPHTERMKRGIKRLEKGCREEDMVEVCRRFIEDYKDFQKYEEDSEDYIVETIEEGLNIIKTFIREKG